MTVTVPNRARSGRDAFFAEIAWPLILLVLSVAFTIPFFTLKTSKAAPNDTARCLANGASLFPWNNTINEYWDPSTALFITLGSGSYTYPEAKSIDVLWDLLIGRGGQVLAAIMAFIVIRKSLLLSIEEQLVPLPLAYSVYFDWISPSLVAAIFRNLTIPFHASTHRDKAVSFWRLLGWLYLCAYVLILPTLMSAMTGYQTTGEIWFQPPFGTANLRSADSLLPNPELTIRDGSRIGLRDGEIVRPNITVGYLEGNSYDEDPTYNSILGYYFMIQRALYNGTWTTPATAFTEPNLAFIGPTIHRQPAWSFCTVSQYGDYCASEYAPGRPGAPLQGTPESVWSKLMIGNDTHSLQPPPLDIVWSAPAETWSLVLTPDTNYGGYYTNSSIAQKSVCLPSAQYQWGFSAVLLCLFCCMTIAFAAILLTLETEVWLDSRSNLYEQRRSGYRDAINVVRALQEELGEDVVANSQEIIEPQVKSYTGSMRIDTEALGLSRRQSGLLNRRPFGRGELAFPDVPLLELSKSDASSMRR